MVGKYSGRNGEETDAIASHSVALFVLLLIKKQQYCYLTKQISLI